MENAFEIIMRSDSAEETRAAGAALAAYLQPGDIVLLSGDLGAGKTQFAQGVAAGLGADEVPVSPTFNIVLSYLSGRLALHHFDLYRLEEPEELEDIGLKEYLESGGVCLVEWADRFPAVFDRYLSVHIAKVSESAREIGVAAKGDRASGLLCQWKRASAPSRALLAESVAKEQRFRDDVDVADIADRGRGSFVLAFDTSNEVVALGVGRLLVDRGEVEVVATREISAHRASNTTLVPAIDGLLSQCGVTRSSLACVCVGRGPGSFTGVRIAMAAAKGISQALGVALVGVSTLDAVAWGVHGQGIRGSIVVVADAMRKEVYPVRYALADEGPHRLEADRVVTAEAFVQELADEGTCEGECAAGSALDLLIAGDGLVKYRELLEPYGRVLSESLWEVTGSGLLAAFEAAWKAREIDPFDACRHDPALILPVYTRLSDAEENERARLASTGEKNLRTGVQDVSGDAPCARTTMHSMARLSAIADERGVSFHPLDAAHARAVALLESTVMGTDAWSERLVADELGRKDRTWWVAEREGALVGYAGGLIVDGDVQVLKVAVVPEWRLRGIARELLGHVFEDARNLGASTCSLEVRAGNVQAQALYKSLGLETVGTRPRYYSDREDAIIMSGALPRLGSDVAGMSLRHNEGLVAREDLEAPSAREDGEGLMLRQSSLRCGTARETLPVLSGYSASVEGLAELSALGNRGGHMLKQSSLRCGTAREASPVSQGCSASAEGEASSLQLQRPLILAIESSCDETAAAVVDGAGRLLSDIVASQIDFHARFGGVVPEIASRKHIEAICGVCAESLDTAGISWGDLDSVAVTYAPGLLGALVVGVAFAKAAAWALDVPFIGVNHLEGHLYANKIGYPDFTPPAVVSLVSGGNTLLVHMRDWGDYAVLGQTIDDAVGEAFDKVSKALGLGYPGGPVISRYAEKGDPAAIAFPRAMMHSHDLRFSLSGLKTAVVNHINNERAAGRSLNVPDIAASFQQAVIDVQVAKARTALEETCAPTFCLGGGVAANPALRAAYEDLCANLGVRLVMPPLSSCGDNAGMIALVALDRYRMGKFFPLDADAQAHADLAEPY